MLLGTDELTILRGSSFYGTWQWINSVTGSPESFAGLSASIKIKNIHEDFADVKNTYEVGTAIVEPLDVDNNIIPGRVDISLSKEDTLCFAIPSGEDDRYGESDFYSILSITLSTGEVILQAKVRVVESLESETLNYLLDEKDEAIIINGKLDNILARNNEFISTRDNLIDVVIPTALLTYNTNHDEKMGIYNANHTNKLDTYNSNDTSKTNIYNQNHATKLQEVNTLALEVQSNKDLVDQAKANVLAMKDDVQGNKESVALMKTAIEVMLDNFDDRFLGLKDTNPTLDNDGNALVIGAIYYNKIAKELRFYNGVSWNSPVAAAQTYALQASQYANDALASKNASKISEDNAKLSEQNAQSLANQVANNYEPKNANIQSHISSSTNPHRTTAAHVGAYSKSESDVKYNLKVNIADIIDNLTSTLTNKPLSANQGKILKGYIDSINTLLTSNDTSLDTLQEVVAYIKANKNNLDALADVHSKTAKTTPVDADEIMIADSASTWSLKKITWANIKTALNSLFIPKVSTPTTNALAKINADGTLKNSAIIEDANGNVGIGTNNPIDKLTMYSASGNLFSRIQSGTSMLLTGVYSDGNTCVNSLGNYSLILLTNNAERMKIDTAGNVGIGDSAPQYKLSIGQSISLPSTAGSKITAFSKYTNVGNASFLRFDTVRISAGSNHNSSEERIRKVIDATEMGYIGFGDNNVVFGNAGGKLATLNTYGFAVDTGAYTGNNYWSNSSKIAGTDWAHFYGTSNNNSIANIIIYGNGNIVNANNSYGALSDIKLKENIVDTSPKLDKLMQVRVVNYNLIGQEQKQIGVIAQEIEQIFPGLIDETKDTEQVEIEKERLIPALDEIKDDDGNVVQESKPEHVEKYMDIETIETGETTKSVKYSVLYMMMLKGMQEQQEIINSLVKRVEILEGAK